MGTVPTVYDWIAHDGLFATAADLEAGVGDVLSFLMNPPGSMCHRGTAQNIPNATATAISLDTEDFDSDNMHSTVTNTTRLTCNTPGQYLVSGMIPYDPGATGGREARIVKNGSGVALPGARTILTPSGSFSVCIVAPTIEVPLLAGDYLELVAFQSNGATLAVTAANGVFPQIRARWVAP